MKNKISKKDFYKKPLKYCPCCKWPGKLEHLNRRKWLSLKRNGVV